MRSRNECPFEVNMTCSRSGWQNPSIFFANDLQPRRNEYKLYEVIANWAQQGAKKVLNINKDKLKYLTMVPEYNRDISESRIVISVS